MERAENRTEASMNEAEANKGNAAANMEAAGEASKDAALSPPETLPFPRQRQLFKPKPPPHTEAAGEVVVAVRQRSCRERGRSHPAYAGSIPRSQSTNRGRVRSQK